MPQISQSYDHYIHLLKNKRSSNPYYNQTAKNLSKLTKTYRSTNQKMSQAMLNNNAPESAKAQLTYDSARNWNDMSNEQMNNATMQDIQRTDQIDEKIGELEFQKSEAIRIEHERKKLAKQNKSRELLKIGGQVVGAGIGALAGGLPGAMIGAGMGATAGSLVDGGLPQDYQTAMQGIDDTLKGFANEANLKEEKQFNEGLSKALPYMKTSQDINELEMLLSRTGKGSYEALDKWIKLKSLQSQPISYRKTYGYVSPYTKTYGYADPSGGVE